VLRISALVLLVGVLPFVAALLLSAVVLPLVQPRATPAARSPLADNVGRALDSTTDRAITVLQERLRARPHDLRSQAALGLAYLQKARETADPSYHTRAEGILLRAHAQAPDDADTLVGLGALAHARHDFEGGLDWGGRAVAANPHKAAGYGLVGQAQLELGRYDDAATTIQKMVDLLPNQASYGLVSYFRELHGDVVGAIEAMEWAVEAGVAGAEGTEWSRIQLGHLHFGSGNVASAEAAYRTALQLRPGFSPALGGLARVAAAREDYATAIALYRQALEAAPLPELTIRLAEVYRAAGQLDEAAQQEALVRAQGQLYAASGVAPDVELIAFELDHDGDVAEAVDWARAELARRPSIQVADTLAWALYRVGACDEADAHSQAALRLGTRDALLLYHAGRIAACAGDPKRAAALLGEALTTNPAFSVRHAPEARQALEALSAPTGDST
jgi:tetratricopeptide (TPR) repeat protein